MKKEIYLRGKLDKKLTDLIRNEYQHTEISTILPSIYHVDTHSRQLAHQPIGSLRVQGYVFAEDIANLPNATIPQCNVSYINDRLILFFTISLKPLNQPASYISLTLQQAKELARSGTKLTHSTFTDKEYLTMQGNLITFEDGVKIMWHDWVEGKDYLKTGWSIYH